MAEIIVKVDDDFLREVNMQGMESQYELIRCKDCMYCIDHRCRKVHTLDDWRMDMDFCSYAERRLMMRQQS